MVPGDGSIEAVVTISDLSIDLEAEISAEIGGICFSDTMTDTVSIATAEVTLVLVLSAEDGEIAVEVSSSHSAQSGVDEGMAGELGLDVSGLIGEVMLEMVEESLPAGLEEALSDTTVIQTIPMMGADISLLATVGDVQTTADGVALRMETLAECSDAVMSAPGSLSVVGDSPDLSDDSAAISVDVLNRMLFLAWRSGAMSEVISDDELGLDPTIIGLIFPGASTLSLELEPQLPPVLLDVGADQPLSLDMVELELTAWGEVSGSEQLLGRIAVHLSGEVTPGISDGALSLTIDIASMQADTIDPEPGEVATAEGLEDLMSLFGGSLGGELLGDVSVPLPGALGTPSDAATDGRGWLIIDTQ
jgi:hypothetical protein